MRLFGARTVVQVEGEPEHPEVAEDSAVNVPDPGGLTSITEAAGSPVPVKVRTRSGSPW